MILSKHTMCYRDGSGGTSAWSTFCHFAKFLIYCHLPKQDAMNFFVSVNELVTETPNVATCTYLFLDVQFFFMLNGSSDPDVLPIYFCIKKSFMFYWGALNYHV